MAPCFGTRHVLYPPPPPSSNFMADEKGSTRGLSLPFRQSSHPISHHLTPPAKFTVQHALPPQPCIDDPAPSPRYGGRGKNDPCAPSPKGKTNQSSRPNRQHYLNAAVFPSRSSYLLPSLLNPWLPATTYLVLFTFTTTTVVC